MQPAWSATAFKLRPDPLATDEQRQARVSVDTALRMALQKYETAFDQVKPLVDSADQLAGLLQMHGVQRQPPRPDSPPQVENKTVPEAWPVTPLQLPRMLKRASKGRSRPSSLMSEGGILPVTPDSPGSAGIRSKLNRQSSARRRRPSSMADFSRHSLTPSPNQAPKLRRSISARNVGDSPLRQTLFSPRDSQDFLSELQEEHSGANHFDTSRSASYAKLTRQLSDGCKPANFISSPLSVRHGSPNPDESMERVWDLETIPGVKNRHSPLDEPQSAPLPLEPAKSSKRYSTIASVTGRRPHREESVSTTRQYHHRRLSSTSEYLGPVVTNSPASHVRSRTSTNKRFSLLSQHNIVSPTPDDSLSSCDSRPEPSRHINALQHSFERVHCERRRFLCALMAVDFAKLLARDSDKIAQVTRTISSVADEMEHLQLVVKRELDRLSYSDVGKGTIAAAETPWSPLLPGAWTNPPSRRASALLSPLDIPQQRETHSSRRDSFRNAAAPNFAPATPVMHKYQTATDAFSSKRTNMSRGLRTIAAKLDIASGELKQRLATVESDLLDFEQERGSERERDLLAVHDSIRSDLEGLMREWDESRVLLRSALHPPQLAPGGGQKHLNGEDQPSGSESAQELDESSDEPASLPSLSHSTSQKRTSSVFSSEARTPERSPPRDILIDPFDSSTPVAIPVASEQVFEATAGQHLEHSKLSREERIRLAKEKRSAAQEDVVDGSQQQPMLTGRCCGFDTSI